MTGALLASLLVLAPAKAETGALAQLQSYADSAKTAFDGRAAADAEAEEDRRSEGERWPELRAAGSAALKIADGRKCGSPGRCAKGAAASLLLGPIAFPAFFARGGYEWGLQWGAAGGLAAGAGGLLAGAAITPVLWPAVTVLFASGALAHLF